MMPVIDTGDHVFHRPSRETWVVRYVRRDRIAWCGWPPGEALLADCLLVYRATPAEREQLVAELMMVPTCHAADPGVCAFERHGLPRCVRICSATPIRLESILSTGQMT